MRTLLAALLALAAFPGKPGIQDEEPRATNDRSFDAGAVNPSKAPLSCLIAISQGRQLPLPLADHHVNAVIRDQIAETTVDQSFVNSTPRAVDGTYWFTLPDGATMHGFGISTGDDPVESDIVDKRSAGPVVQKIARQQPHAMTVDWAHGRVFKARVLAIEPHSEIRVRVRYTELLRLEGARLRYRCALRGRYRRTPPIRDLAVRVEIASTHGIEHAESTTHAARVVRRPGTAILEFGAEQCTPDRDFVAQFEISDPPALTAVSHSRGGDHYFMLMLSPPESRRDVPPAETSPQFPPLDILIIADTSGSMSPSARRAQAGFVAALLETLGPGNRFEMMACDAVVQWLFPQPTAVTEKSIEQALALLNRRQSLGWTNIELAMSAALEKTATGKIVVYVGDGVGTSGDADPAALAERLRHLDRRGGVFHAVSPSRIADRSVLHAIASPDGGSVHTVGEDPRRTALALLHAESQPPIEDLRVEFEGVQAALVYPEPWTGRSAHSQQVRLGRFLPGEPDRGARVIVTGMVRGEPVRYETDLPIHENTARNASISRLWGARRVEALLARGQHSEIQDEVVALSAQLNILTPFTAFLVLEDDESRLCFGVERRVAQHGSAWLFAGAREPASNRRAKEIQNARAWRASLREQTLREISQLGVNLHDQPVGLVDGTEPHAGRGLAPPHLRRGDVAGGLLVSFGDASRGDRRATRRSATPSLPRSFWRDGPAAQHRAPQKQPSLDDPLSHLYFPGVPAPVAVPDAALDPDWQPEILALLRSLDRRGALSSMTGGISFECEQRTRLSPRGDQRDRVPTTALWSATEWWSRGASWNGDITENWLAGDTRGRLSVAMRLGRARPATETDRTARPAMLKEESMVDLVRKYRTRRAEIVERDGNRVTVALASSHVEDLWFVVDAARGVLLEKRTVKAGAVMTSIHYGDHVRVAGQWWPTRVEHRDPKGQVISFGTQRVTGLSPREFRAQLSKRLASHGDAIVIRAPGRERDDAEQAVREGRGEVGDFLTLAWHYSVPDRETAWQFWTRAKPLLRYSPGKRWIQLRILSACRRHEELRARLREAAAAVAGSEGSPAAFLARRIFYTAHLALGGDDAIDLWNAMRPVSSQPSEDAPWGERSWRRIKAELTLRTGRFVEALDLRSAMAADLEHDPRVVRSYLDLLLMAGEYGRAAEFVRTALSPAGEWLDHEADKIYTHVAEALWKQREVSRLVPLFEHWLLREPADEQVYVRYLSVLLNDEREREADAWIRTQLTAEPDMDDPVRRARLVAAIQVALGLGWNFKAGEVDPAWRRPLARLARRLAVIEDSSYSLADRIIADEGFRRTDAWAELRVQLADDLEQHLESIGAKRLERYLRWLPWSHTEADQRLRRTVVDRVERRWAATVDGSERSRLAKGVLALLDAGEEKDRALTFLRRGLRSGPNGARLALARELMQRLTKSEWSPAVEEEMFALIPKLRAEGVGEQRWQHELASTYRWLAEKLYAMRLAKATGQGDPCRARDLRRSLAASFAAHKRAARQPAQRWLEIERLCLEVKTGGDLAASFDAAEALLMSISEAETTGPTGVLRERCHLVLEYAASRRGAPESLASRLLDRYHDGLSDRPELLDWRYRISHLLIAVNRPEALKREIVSWNGAGPEERRWRITLGYLQTELGPPPEAEQRADWFEAMTNAELSQILGREMRRLTNTEAGQRPTLDPLTVLAAHALLANPRNPHPHVAQVVELYAHVRDPRLLECFATGLVGRDHSSAYHLLDLVGKELNEVQEEAACTALADRAAELAKGVRDATERRPLLVLEALALRRAGELSSQPEKHVARFRRAMRTAMSDRWHTEERSQVLRLRTLLGEPAAKSFADALTDLLEEHEEPESPVDRLRKGETLSSTLWKRGDQEAAIARRCAALEDYRNTHGSQLGFEAERAFRTLIRWLESRSEFAVAERYVQDELERQVTARGRCTYQGILLATYDKCLRAGGAVSLGSGLELYRALRPLMERALWEWPPDRSGYLLEWYCRLHQHAYTELEYQDAGTDLARFADQAFPGPLTRLLHRQPKAALTLVRTLRGLGRAEAALELVVGYLEAEPRWRMRMGHSGWRNFASEIAALRWLVQPQGELERRLAAVTLHGLRHQLTWNGQPSGIFRRGNSASWRGKAEDFAEVAREVIRTSERDPKRLNACCNYLAKGLGLEEEAVAAFAAAEARGGFDQKWRRHLVWWLKEVKRYRRALAVLERLLADFPDQLSYRHEHIRILQVVGRHDDALASVKAAEQRLRDQGLWPKHALAMARVCCETGLYAQSVTYLEQITRQRSISQDPGVRATAWSLLSHSCLKLGRLDSAITAATASVLEQGPGSGRRHGHTSTSLQRLVREIADLDSFVRQRDETAAASGMSASLRKCFGQVYLERGQPEKAIEQLSLARSLRPVDAEIHLALAGVHRTLGDDEMTLRAVLDGVRASLFDSNESLQLTNQLMSMVQGDDAERVRTNLVEAQPYLAESHRILAREYEGTGRSAEAITQWQQAVRILSDDPFNWLGLAQAQIVAGRTEAAQRTMEYVRQREFDRKWGDIRATTRRLEQLSARPPR